MYDHNITLQEIADFIADMLEMSSADIIPTEDDINQMALAMA